MCYQCSKYYYVLKLCVIPLLDLGFLTTKASQSTDITAQPGDNVTIWCKHTSKIGKYIQWFKQINSAVPLSIVYMMLPYTLEVKATHLNGFQPDRLVMSLNSKNTSLRMLNVDISDSGLYYCGWQKNWVLTFGDGTQLDIKGNTFSTAHLLNSLHII